MKKSIIIQLSIFLIFSLKSMAQAYTPVNPQRVLVGAFPFQNFTYDARSASLGEAGIAISPDANSAFMNPAKLTFLSQDSTKKKQNTGISLHYMPYYRKLIQGMNLYGANIFQVKERNAYGLTLKYFDTGNVEIRNNAGQFQKNFSSKEYSITGFYSKQFKHNNSFSVGLKYIYSNLSSPFSNTKPVNTITGDLCFFHNSPLTPDGGTKKRSWLNYGASLTNIGGKVSYGDYKSGTPPERTFQSTLLKFGAAQNFILGKKGNVLMFTTDVNKLLVPTPSIRNANNEVIAGSNEENISGIGTIIQSWGTAPDGLKETLREFAFSLGTEFRYREFLAIRAGYYAQNKRKGDIHYFTLGIGGKFNDFGLDFSYLIPQKRNEILSNTFHISLNYCPFK